MSQEEREFFAAIKSYMRKIAEELKRMNELKALALGLRLENGTSARNRLDEIMED